MIRLGGGGLSRKFTLGVVTVAASAVNCDCFFRLDVTEVTRSRYQTLYL